MYTVESGKFSHNVHYASHQAFKALESRNWALNRLKNNQDNITKFTKKMENPKFSEFKGEYAEEIEEMKFYNKFLPEYAEFQYQIFMSEGGILNNI